MPVGPQPEQYMHTTVGGQPDAPPLVLCPGYGAGTGFFFRYERSRLVVVGGAQPEFRKPQPSTPLTQPGRRGANRLGSCQLDECGKQARQLPAGHGVYTAAVWRPCRARSCNGLPCLAHAWRWRWSR